MPGHLFPKLKLSSHCLCLVNSYFHPPSIVLFLAQRVTFHLLTTSDSDSENLLFSKMKGGKSI